MVNRMRTNPHCWTGRQKKKRCGRNSQREVRLALRLISLFVGRSCRPLTGEGSFHMFLMGHVVLWVVASSLLLSSLDGDSNPY